jgi:hypothetical protein
MDPYAAVRFMDEMSMTSQFDYGHWWTAGIFATLWSLAFLRFLGPRTPAQWFGFLLLVLFLADEFIELYAVPFSLSLFVHQLTEYPAVDLLYNRAGDLWRVWFRTDDRAETLDSFHLMGGIFIFGGLGMLFYAYKTRRDAEANGVPATGGPYRWVRHPHYLALIASLIGFLIQGPTVPTLILFPILLVIYVLLALSEEKELLKRFGAAYRRYIEQTPRFLPQSPSG